MQVLFSENQDINRPKSNLQPVKPIKSTNNSTWPYLIENPVHFIYEIKTKAMMSSALTYATQKVN